MHNALHAELFPGAGRKNKNREARDRTLPGSRFEFLSGTVRLPAAVSASAAISAVTVPASAPTATAATASASSSTTAPAEAATTAPASAAPAAFTRGSGFVDDNVSTHEIMAIQSLDGALGFLVAIDFDKSEPAWLP